MEHIIRNVTPNSLVIIDELCRSTNPKEGAQLAWSLCEHLASMRGIANDGEYFNDCVCKHKNSYYKWKYWEMIKFFFVGK